MSFSIRLQATKSKHIVPIVNDIPIHSLLNPIREAEVFASNYMSQVSSNPNVLILGLGFAYHIDELEKLLSIKHKNFKIYVIEGIADLAKSCLSYRTLSSKIKVFHPKNPLDLFFNEAFCSFLLSKPTIIMHPSLYKLNDAYYKSILTHRASIDPADWRTPGVISEKPELKEIWHATIRELKHAEF